MRVDFSSNYFGATLAAPKARSAKLGSALGLGQLLLSPFRRARVAPNGSSFLSRFPEKVVHPDFKIPGKARRCAWRSGSPRDSEKPGLVRHGGRRPMSVPADSPEPRRGPAVSLCPTPQADITAPCNHSASPGISETRFV